jgi:hypothetical protein
MDVIYLFYRIKRGDWYAWSSRRDPLAAIPTHGNLEKAFRALGLHDLLQRLMRLDSTAARRFEALLKTFA